jgi:hypothetical protein
VLGLLLAAAVAASPLELYDRAYAAAQAERVPPYVEYDMHLVFVHRGMTERENDHIVLRTSDGAAYVRSLDDAGTKTPPHVAKRPPYGVAPIALVGLYHYPTNAGPSMLDAPPDPSASAGPAEIGRVTSVAHPYDVTIGDDTAFEGRADHLVLVPRFEPERHTLRELYLDHDTYLPLRTVLQAHLAVSGLVTRPLFTIDYSVVDGIDVISHAWTSFTFRVAFITYSGSFDYRTSNVTFPASAPAGVGL